MKRLNALTKQKLDNFGHLDIKDMLFDDGWRRLGAGAFSEVYEHPACDNVLKVGGYMDGWLTWAEACQWIESPHKPIVYAIQRFPHFYFAEIERLEHRSTFELPESARLFATYISKMGIRGMDLQPNNIMERPSTGDVVFSDPWA